MVYEGLDGGMEGGGLMDLGLGMGLRTAGGGSMYDTPGVGLEEVRFEEGVVQWLMMVEFVF